MVVALVFCTAAAADLDKVALADSKISVGAVAAALKATWGGLVQVFAMLVSDVADLA